MIDTASIKSALPILGLISALVVLFYFLYAKSGFRKLFTVLLSWSPFIFRYLASQEKDEPRVFDKHDLFILIARVSEKLKGIISDPANVTFTDVEDDIEKLVEGELALYKEAGLRGVPDLKSDAIKEQVHVIFSIVKRLSDESPAGNTVENQATR